MSEHSTVEQINRVIEQQVVLLDIDEVAAKSISGANSCGRSPKPGFARPASGPTP